MRTVSYCIRCGVMMQSNDVVSEECEACLRKKTQRVKARVHDSANIPYPKFLQELRTKTLAASKAED